LSPIGSVEDEPHRERMVHFYGHGALPCRVFRRTAMPVDQRLAGPLIVEEEGSTTLVEPGMHVTRTQHDILLLEV